MKRTLAFLLSLLMLVSCFPAGAITLEAVESSEETATVAEPVEAASEEAAELAAVTYEAKPGLNAVNNKAELETFDDETDFSALNITFVGVGENGDTPAYEIAQDPLNTADETDKAAIFYGKVPASDSDHAVYTHFDITMAVDINRRYYTTASVYEPEKTGNCLWIMRTDGSKWADPATSYKTAIAAGNYYTYTGQLRASTNMTKFEYRVKSVGKTGDDGTTYVDTYVPFYLDNLAVVPYYRITYHGVTDVYTLFENDSKPSMDTILTTYTVNSAYKPYETTKVSETTGAVMEFAGWSTVKDGTVDDIVTEITLENEDVYLYPVWAEPELVSGTPYMNAKSGTTNTLTASEACTWEFVDGGNTDITAEDVVFSEDGLTCTITAEGYTGEVIVKATSVADETKTATVKVRLRGAGNDFKPGINQLTGTDEGYSFEAPTSTERNLTYTIPNGNVTKLTDIPRFTPGVNTSYTSIKMIYNSNKTDQSQTYPQIAYRMPAAIYERPMQYEFNYTGVAGHMWFMNGSAIDEDVSSMVNVGKTGWVKSSYKWIPEGATTAFVQTAINYSQASNIFYMDNVKFIPYYAMNYVGLDGTTAVETKYELLTAGGNVMKEYTPDNSVVEGATGYALEAGGERVPVVNLANDDLTFYAIATDEASFIAYDNTYVNVALEEGQTEYTFVKPEELGLGTEKHFMYWTDGTNKYYPGDTITAEEFIGKNFEAYEFEYALFSEMFGELIAYYDFNENLKATYINTDYDTNSVNANVAFGASNPGATSGGVLELVERADGRKVAHFYTSVNNGSYRFVQLNLKSTVPAKYTPMVGVMLPKEFPRLYYSTSTPFVRVQGSGTTSYVDKFYDINSTSNIGLSASLINPDTLTYARSQSLLLNSLSNVGFNWSVSTYHKYGYHFDNYGVYAFPSYAVFFKDSADSDHYTKQTLDTSAGNPTTYTFPTAEEAIALGAGFEETHFVAWTIDGKTFYKPGDTVALSTVQYKVIYPYLQDPSVPAMGYSYEGTPKVDLSKAKYSEAIEDDGRTVLHSVQWGTTYEKATTYVKDENGKNTSEIDYITYKYVSDPRLQIAGSGYAFDASEYYHVQYMAKVTHSSSVSKNTFKDTTPGDYTAEERAAAGFQTPDEIKASRSWIEGTMAPFRIYYWTSTASNGYYNNGEHLVGNKGQEFSVDNNYHLLEVDMSVASNGNSKAPWLGGTDGKIYGFCVDPSKLTWGADMYIDYLRVYRGGISTVNYDTNAPADGTVVTKVDPDTNRGVGTGYLLKGERPVVTGYKFLGWAETANATAADVVEKIDLVGFEKTVYAVWEKDTGAINASDEIAMRLDEGKESGIRFKATVTNDQRESVDEYGFIVARKSHLETYDAELNHNFKNRSKNQNLFAEGQAYGYSEKYGKDIDVIFNAVEATGEVTYAVVCTGMEIDATGVNEVMVARPYYRYTINGNDIYVYGEAAEASLGSVAAGIDKESEDYINNKEFLDEIIGLITTEESTEE